MVFHSMCISRHLFWLKIRLMTPRLNSTPSHAIHTSAHAHTHTHTLTHAHTHITVNHSPALSLCLSAFVCLCLSLSLCLPLSFCLSVGLSVGVCFCPLPPSCLSSQTLFSPLLSFPGQLPQINVGVDNTRNTKFLPMTLTAPRRTTVWCNTYVTQSIKPTS